MNLNCIIVEDEPLARQKMEQYILKVPLLKLIGSFEDPLEALVSLKSNKVDLIFLDIQMDNLNGIQFIEALENPPKIIITSAYDKYAVQGFEFRVADFLLKPVPFDRFLKAVDKVFSDLKVQKVESPYIFVKTEYRMERVDLQDILYIEGMKDYLKIVTGAKNILTLQSFSSIEQNLNPNFVRVHKSYIVALDKIRSIERHIIRIHDKEINIGLSYRPSFYKLINANL